jgi:Flp pilus assembly pilin Flp
VAVLGRAGRAVQALWSADRGATSVEYAILLSAIAGVVIAVVFLLGISTDGLFGRVTTLWP